LDGLLERTPAASETHTDALRALYGVPTATGNPVSVYIATAVGSSLAVCAVYWGPACPSNLVCAVPGVADVQHAAAYGVLRGLLMANPVLPLRVYLTGEYVACSVCHWAPMHAWTGWRCANADILQDLTRVIAHR
ncbi:hypothetical protein OBBRIDRAFT_707486, partial [Obba rivulosa]